jgi:hypothetical protein
MPHKHDLRPLIQTGGTVMDRLFDVRDKHHQPLM